MTKKEREIVRAQADRIDYVLYASCSIGEWPRQKLRDVQHALEKLAFAGSGVSDG